MKHPVRKKQKDLIDLEQAAREFLKTDFTETLSLAKYYDQQITDIFKFLITTYITVATIIIGLYQFPFENSQNTIARFILGLSPAFITGLSISFIFGLSMFFLIVRNRVYFVRCMRYINEQRSTFLHQKPMNFENRSKIYSEYNKPKYFDKFSTQSLFLYVVSALNAFIAGVIFFLLNLSTIIIILFGIVIIIFELLTAICYLKHVEKESGKGE